MVRYVSVHCSVRVLLPQESVLQGEVPTLVLHGRQDEVIPIQASRNFAQSRAGVKLVELESDHALTDVQEQLWQEIQAFCQLESKPLL
ncbi:MAG: hypothetical protein HC767_13750 [Akkermansiaceae bacterium]|nr:hypothetical protein [Akkermansiaceae bacterium]